MNAANSCANKSGHLQVLTTEHPLYSGMQEHPPVQMSVVMLDSVDMGCYFLDPMPEQQNVVLIDAATVQKAQRISQVL
jgi:hypothetical protein